MNVDLIFKIAAIGILISVLNQVLTRSGRDEQATMTTLAGLVVVLMMVVQQISELFELVKVTKKPDVEVPRSYRDYDAAIDLKHIPAGVEVGFQTYTGITWGKLPENENWFHEA